MTNKIALFLGLMILGALMVDAVFYGWDSTVFLARKFVDLIEWLKFWR